MLKVASPEEILAMGQRPLSDLADNALADFVSALKGLKLNCLEAVYATKEDERVRVLTVVSKANERSAIHKVEKRARLAYPTLLFDFRVLPSEALEQRQIEEFRKKFKVEGDPLYSPRPQ